MTYNLMFLNTMQVFLLLLFVSLFFAGSVLLAVTFFPVFRSKKWQESDKANGLNLKRYSITLLAGVVLLSTCYIPVMFNTMLRENGMTKAERDYVDKDTIYEWQKNNIGKPLPDHLQALQDRLDKAAESKLK